MMSMAVLALDEVKKSKSFTKIDQFRPSPEPYIPRHWNNRYQMTIQIYTVASIKCFLVCRTENTGNLRDNL